MAERAASDNNEVDRRKPTGKPKASTPAVGNEDRRLGNKMPRRDSIAAEAIRDYGDYADLYQPHVTADDHPESCIAARKQCLQVRMLFKFSTNVLVFGIWAIGLECKVALQLEFIKH